jgi:transposase
MAYDGQGRPVRFVIALGQSHDILAVLALLRSKAPADKAPADVVADRAHDGNIFRHHLHQIGAEAMIPSTRSRRVPILYESVLSRLCNRIERYFTKFEHFRRFATRYDRLTSHYAAFVHVAAATLDAVNVDST